MVKMEARRRRRGRQCQGGHDAFVLSSFFHHERIAISKHGACGESSTQQRETKLTLGDSSACGQTKTGVQRRQIFQWEKHVGVPYYTFQSVVTSVQSRADCRCSPAAEQRKYMRPSMTAFVCIILNLRAEVCRGEKQTKHKTRVCRNAKSDQRKEKKNRISEHTSNKPDSS